MIIEELTAILGYDLQGEQNLRRFQRGLGEARRGLTTFQAALAGFAGGIAASVFANLTGQVREFLDAIGPGAVVRTGATFEQMRIQLTSLEGSAEKAEKSLQWIRDFAVRTPLELEDVIQAFIRLRIGGMEPTDGTLQALVDTASAFGATGADMNAIIVQLGQAWQKTKLQMQDIRPLIDRGIPVWEVLSDVMGKSTAEIIKMSEAGKIGRAEMTKMIEELGRRYAGSADKMSKAFAGIMGNLADMRTEFLNMVADAGFFDVIKKKGEEFLETLKRMQRDGSLRKLAEQYSEFLVKGVQAMERGVQSLGRVARLVAGAFDVLSSSIEAMLGKLGFGQGGALSKILAGGAIAAPLVGRAGLMRLASMFPFVALILLLEDFATHAEGGESVIGRIIDSLDFDTSEFANIASVLGEIRGFFEWLIGVIGSHDKEGRLVSAFNILIDRSQTWSAVIKGIRDFLREIDQHIGNIRQNFGSGGWFFGQQGAPVGPDGIIPVPPGAREGARGGWRNFVPDWIERGVEGIGNMFTPASTGPQRTGGRGRMSAGEIYGTLLNAGATEDEARTMTAIALAESSGNPRAYNGRGRDRSYGLFQVNMLGGMGPERRRRYGLSSNEDLYDPATNARVALGLKRARGNYRDWSVYLSGAYRNHLGAARAAKAPAMESPPIPQSRPVFSAGMLGGRSRMPNNVTINAPVNITANGAKADPKEIGREVEKAVGSAARRASDIAVQRPEPDADFVEPSLGEMGVP